MKMCLILQRRFAYVGHELATHLAKNSEIKEFCAFVQTRSSFEFLSTQTEIQYSGLMLDEEVQRRYIDEPLDIEYLRWLEKEYGIPNLWPYINVDRIIRFGQLVREYPHDTSRYSHEEMLRMVQVYAKALIEFLDTQKPDVLFSAPIGGMSTMLLHHIAKKRGIRVVVMAFTGLRNLTTVSEEYDRLSFVEEIVDRDQATPLQKLKNFAEVSRYIEEYRKTPQVYSEIHESSRQKFKRIQYFNFLNPRRFLRSVNWLIVLFIDGWRHPDHLRDYSYIHPAGYVVDAIKRKVRNLIGLGDLYGQFDRTQSYTFFALHLEPELSLLLLARFDIDQIGAVRRVAQSLPVGMKLVVKDHPQMVALRPRSFYKALKKIPNVVLIRPEVSSFDVIAGAALVTTITGTAGWEATLLGKPVITFGDIFYNALPNVLRSLTPEELPMLVMRQLSGDFRFDEEALIRFVAAIFEDSAHVDILNIWELGGKVETRGKELAALAKLIAEKSRARQ